MSIDVFIFGIQKSGTTWMRNILSHVGKTSAKHEWQLPMLFRHMDAYVTLCGGGRHADPALITTIVEKTYDTVLNTFGVYNIDKSAFPCLPESGRDDDLYPHAMLMMRRAFPKARTLMIVRDPRDVLVSSCHYFDLQEVAMDEEYITAFANSWSKCNLNWMLCKPDSIVRFEDLKLEFRRTVRDCITEVGLNIDDLTIQILIDHYQTIEFSQISDAFFYRKGEAGGWRRSLSERNAEIIKNTAGFAMQVFDYV